MEYKYWIAAGLVGYLLLAGCSANTQATVQESQTVEFQSEPTETIQPVQEDTAVESTSTAAIPTEENLPEPTDTPGENSTAPISQAEVLAVNLNGEPGNYSFSVKISSPDEGCNQYADWWEVLSLEGELIYRRILLHSHVDEQPFTRSGGPVPIEAATDVLVRVHMNNSGYSNLAMKGSPEQGFEQVEIDSDFAQGLHKIPPLPGDCNF